jgi:hypothetical protein
MTALFGARELQIISVPEQGLPQRTTLGVEVDAGKVSDYVVQVLNPYAPSTSPASEPFIAEARLLFRPTAEHCDLRALRRHPGRSLHLRQPVGAGFSQGRQRHRRPVRHLRDARRASLRGPSRRLEFADAGLRTGAAVGGHR